jgi:hypothetical protein
VQALEYGPMISKPHNLTGVCRSPTPLHNSLIKVRNNTPILPQILAPPIDLGLFNLQFRTSQALVVHQLYDADFIPNDVLLRRTCFPHLKYFDGAVAGVLNGFDGGEVADGFVDEGGANEVEGAVEEEVAGRAVEVELPRGSVGHRFWWW